MGACKLTKCRFSMQSGWQGRQQTWLWSASRLHDSHLTARGWTFPQQVAPSKHGAHQSKLPPPLLPSPPTQAHPLWLPSRIAFASPLSGSRSMAPLQLTTYQGPPRPPSICTTSRVKHRNQIKGLKCVAGRLLHSGARYWYCSWRLPNLQSMFSKNTSMHSSWLHDLPSGKLHSSISNDLNFILLIFM